MCGVVSPNITLVQVLHLCISQRNPVQPICFYYTPSTTTAFFLHHNLWVSSWDFLFLVFSHSLIQFPRSLLCLPLLFSILNLICRMLLFIIKASHLKYSRRFYYPSLINVYTFAYVGYIVCTYGYRSVDVMPWHWFVCAIISLCDVWTSTLLVLCQHFELMCVRLINNSPCEINTDSRVHAHRILNFPWMVLKFSRFDLFADTIQSLRL